MQQLRNSKSRKTVQAEFGVVELEMPRDRHSSFEPPLMARGQLCTEVLDKAILSLYARGMSTRDIETQLKELYDVDVRAVPTNTRVLAPAMVCIVRGKLLRTSAHVAQVSHIAAMAHGHSLQVTGIAGMR
ncbi:transposase [Meiothermus granaticius]